MFFVVSVERYIIKTSVKTKIDTVIMGNGGMGWKNL